MNNKLTLKDIRRINKEFRLKDDSRLYPIMGRFNATERAIRRLRKYQRQGLVIDSAYSYGASLEGEISNIVNKAV